MVPVSLEYAWRFIPSEHTHATFDEEVAPRTLEEDRVRSTSHHFSILSSLLPDCPPTPGSQDHCRSLLLMLTSYDRLLIVWIEEALSDHCIVGRLDLPSCDGKRQQRNF
jgi:hypothetical protein